MKPLRHALLVAAVLGLLIALLDAEAQPARKMPRIGYLSLGAAAPPAILVERIREAGYVDGQNVRIDYRFGEGRHDVMGALAKELVDLGVDVIMAVGDEAVMAAKKATATIPIVMFSCDALAVGFVNSLARPGGNITGVTCVTAQLSPKRVALLRKAVPRASRVGLLFNPANVAKPFDADRTQRAAQSMNLTILSREFLEPSDLDRVFAAFARERTDALIVLDESFTLLHAKRIAELAIRNRLPAMHSFKEAVVAGGLMSYGPSVAEMLSISSTYVVKVLKGAKPADLPVEQPTRLELVVNLKTAKALWLAIPPSVLVQADEVIE
jgi:putative tryptophan/tyrosine transport system substrate-binding protein